MLTEEYRYKILKELEADPQLSQRELAKRLGISLGKANYCLKALMEKGLVKAENFKNNPQKSGYLYLLTLHGLEEKAVLTKRFLKRKIKEHEELTAEIEMLRREVQDNTKDTGTISYR
ncbi:MarR family EPS-associated transcriptional regulator [Maribrevibacterium harenarium]|uniref:MarR family EPS-associated transcriptional regulator n=1 Tax=Maribrevibacterium harenarium TaxID=2589817 RepID=A0A501WYG4_9GAMM|nr:MarR family EPS-associated transcriptional regulator [Maribrevibacterium harenarium]TPE54299.1 MarR family EPS-associated transcriptional regulator [Maribrevibacterium harenarium]